MVWLVWWIEHTRHTNILNNVTPKGSSQRYIRTSLFCHYSSIVLLFVVNLIIIAQDTFQVSSVIVPNTCTQLTPATSILSSTALARLWSRSSRDILTTASVQFTRTNDIQVNSRRSQVTSLGSNTTLRLSISQQHKHL